MMKKQILITAVMIASMALIFGCSGQGPASTAATQSGTPEGGVTTRDAHRGSELHPRFRHWVSNR